MKKLIPLFLWLATPACGQDLSSQFDTLIQEKYKVEEPGAAALVAKGSDILYRKAFGMADLENKVVLTPDHVFEIGSITKQFTAVAILMLLEEGKLALTDPITKFIPTYPMHGHTITVHHLLTHTSGIKSYTSMESWTKLWRQDKTPMEMIDLFKSEPMDFAPGEKWMYNNSAYFMLGYVIEKASGIPYPEFLEKRIFIPLGMKSSYYGDMSRLIPHRARGYQHGEIFKNAEYLSLTQPYAAGSIMSTVDDLLAWNRAIHAGKLVKKETLQKAFTDYKLNNGKSTHYGYGWALSEINGSPTLEHSGGIFGYTTNGIYLPKEDVYVIFLTNRDDRDPSEVSLKMAALAIGKPFTKAEAKIKLDEAYAKSLTGVYDFDEGISRVITYAEGQLYSQRAGANFKYKLLPQDKTHFLFEGDNSSIEFVDPKTGPKELLLKNRLDVSKGVKTNKPIPVHLEIAMSEPLLKPFVGVYEIQPGFDITITLEGGHLMSQATGQQKFELFAENESRFFLKVVDAQIEFKFNEKGDYDSLILFQGGRQIPGKKKQ